MKKLYSRGTVHPSPPISTDVLSFLPAALVTLAAALSPAEREVLAYLISASSNSSSVFISSGKKVGLDSAGGQRDHGPRFTCDCFRCYMSYWVRWDSSPNRELIHEILDGFEEGLVQREQGKKQRRRRRELKRAESRKEEAESSELVPVAAGGGGEKGSMRSFVSFIGEKIWGVLGA